MLNAVPAINPREEVKYEAADGSHIPITGEQDFAAFIIAASYEELRHR